MNTEKKLQIDKTQSEIAFRLQNLMIVNLKEAYRTLDSTIVSKYLEISNISFAGMKKR